MIKKVSNISLVAALALATTGCASTSFEQVVSDVFMSAASNVKERDKRISQRGSSKGLNQFTPVDLIVGVVNTTINSKSEKRTKTKPSQVCINRCSLKSSSDFDD